MDRLTHARIERAIRSAEAGTTGHILVRIVPDANVNAFERARTEFAGAGLHGAPQRNATLVLVAPQAKKYAVIGDRAIHERVGDAFWRAVVAEMQPYFSNGDITGAILLAVEKIGTELRSHFPARPQGTPR